MVETVNRVLCVGNGGPHRAFEPVIAGKILTVGAGDLMHALGSGHAVADGTPEVPRDENHQRPGADKANWD